MTIDQFKKLSPESANLKGNQLWDAMEDYMLKHGNEEIKRRKKLLRNNYEDGKFIIDKELLKP